MSYPMKNVVLNRNTNSVYGLLQHAPFAERGLYSMKYTYFVGQRRDFVVNNQ